MLPVVCEKRDLGIAQCHARGYLETVEKVFQTYDLPLGKLRYRCRLVNPAAVRRTALMTVEGERDDICAVGQTVAAQMLVPCAHPEGESRSLKGA